MSLIHEALKKVERQRQLGKAPTLASPVFQRRRKRRWVLPALALAVVVASVCLLWLWRTPAPAGAELASATPQTAASAPLPRSTKPVSVAAQRKPAAPKSAAQDTPAAANEGNERAAPVQPVAAAAAPVQEDKWIAVPAPRPAQSRVGRRSSIDNPDTEPAAGAKTTPGAKQERKAALVQVKPLPAKSEESKPASEPASEKLSAVRSNPASAPARSSSAPPMYWDLPYAERRDLPAFQISMHVFADNPADRFVILNGVRQVEGDELPSGIRLVAILADGIVLESDGKRFTVPRDGGY